MNTSPDPRPGCPVSGGSSAATATWDRFLDHDNRHDPYPLYARLRDTAPVQRLDDVFVAGDVAAFPHPSGDGRRISVEHWGNAVGQASVAADNMRTDGHAHHDEVPVFWSNQFGHVIKSVGTPEAADTVVVAQGSTGDRAFVAVYGADDRMVGATALDHVKWIEHYRSELRAGAIFPPRGATLDGRTDEDREVEPHTRATPPEARLTTPEGKADL